MAAIDLGRTDPPALRNSWAKLWSLTRIRMREAGLPAPSVEPESPRGRMEVWTDPDLLLAQVDAYAFVSRLHSRVRLVCTPAYEAPGCSGALRRAAILVRADDPTDTLGALRERRAAIDHLDAHEGFNLLRALLAGGGAKALPLEEALQTGSAAASVEAVAENRADFACVDAVTLAHLRRLDRPLLDRVRPLLWTTPAPGSPLVTRWATDRGTLQALQRALQGALKGLEPRAREALQIRAFVPIAGHAFAPVAAAERAGKGPGGHSDRGVKLLAEGLSGWLEGGTDRGGGGERLAEGAAEASGDSTAG